MIIASATDTHFPYIMESLRADKAVLAEKPISHELHEVGPSHVSPDSVAGPNAKTKIVSQRDNVRLLWSSPLQAATSSNKFGCFAR